MGFPYIVALHHLSSILPWLPSTFISWLRSFWSLLPPSSLPHLHLSHSHSWLPITTPPPFLYPSPTSPLLSLIPLPSFQTFAFLTLYPTLSSLSFPLSSQLPSLILFPLSSPSSFAPNRLFHFSIGFHLVALLPFVFVFIFIVICFGETGRRFEIWHAEKSNLRRQETIAERGQV